MNSSPRLQPTCTLPVAFSYMLCMSRTSHLSMPEPTRWHVWVNNGMPLPHQHMSCTVTYWWQKTFLIAGKQWILHLWCCVQAWSQSACHWFASVVIKRSQPPILEHSWPGLAILGLNNFLVQARCPCSCRGRGWFSPPIKYIFSENRWNPRLDHEPLLLQML